MNSSEEDVTLLYSRFVIKLRIQRIFTFEGIMLGTAFNIAYWHRKYHSGTICKGVSNPQTSNALSGCEKEEIPK